MDSAIDYLISLFGNLINFLDSLEVVHGITVLSIFIGVVVITVVISAVFRTKEE